MKYPCYKIFYLLAVLILLGTGTTGAQNTVQVYTKTINRTLNYEPGENLEIMAEKANVTLSGWNQRHIAIEVKLISKHTKKEIAEKELDYLKFDISRQENTHILKNYFLAGDNFRKVKGRLLIHYQIRVPAHCPVLINNLYGKVTVDNLKNSLMTRTRFVELLIENCEGKFNIESIFGNVLVNKSSGKLTGDLKKANLELSGFEGDVEIEGNYGNIDIESDKLASLKVNGSRTRISLLTTNLPSYNYDLNTSFAEIKIPDITPAGHSPEKKSFKKTFHQKNPLITIHTTYSPIEIKLQYNASNK